MSRKRKADQIGKTHDIFLAPCIGIEGHCSQNVLVCTQCPTTMPEFLDTASRLFCETCRAALGGPEDFQKRMASPGMIAALMGWLAEVENHGDDHLMELTCLSSVYGESVTQELCRPLDWEARIATCFVTEESKFFRPCVGKINMPWGDLCLKPIDIRKESHLCSHCQEDGIVSWEAKAGLWDFFISSYRDRVKNRLPHDFQEVRRDFLDLVVCACGVFYGFL